MYSRTLTHSAAHIHPQRKRSTERARHTDTFNNEVDDDDDDGKTYESGKEKHFFPSLFVEMVHQYTKRVEFRFERYIDLCMG